MRQASQLIKKLKDDEKGAALVEYTVLLGVMLVAVISTIMLGGWVNTRGRLTACKAIDRQLSCRCGGAG
jgi:pilus assembly protein Flp/PilA